MHEGLVVKLRGRRGKERKMATRSLVVTGDDHDLLLPSGVLRAPSWTNKTFHH